MRAKLSHGFTHTDMDFFIHVLCSSTLTEYLFYKSVISSNSPSAAISMSGKYWPMTAFGHCCVQWIVDHYFPAGHIR